MYTVLVYLIITSFSHALPKIIFMVAFGVEDLTTTDKDILSGVILLLFAYGPASASFTYCFSFMFSSPAYCSILNIVFAFLIGESSTPRLG